MPVDTFVENTWYVAGRSQEFAVDEPAGRVIAGRPVLIWRTRDRTVGAFDDRCVHKRMPLSEGRVLADGLLECAYHGFCYDAAGGVVDRKLLRASGDVPCILDEGIYGHDSLLSL